MKLIFAPCSVAAAPLIAELCPLNSGFHMKKVLLRYLVPANSSFSMPGFSCWCQSSKTTGVCLSFRPSVAFMCINRNRKENGIKLKERSTSLYCFQRCRMRAGGIYSTLPPAFLTSIYALKTLSRSHVQPVVAHVSKYCEFRSFQLVI